MFERYTDAAKRAIFYARAEAINQNVSVISVKHLLVGLTYEDSSRACQVGSLKENAENLRSFLGVPHPASSQSNSALEIPLDTDAKKTLAYAARECDQDRCYWLDTDHLLRGLLRFPNEATPALEETGLALESARAASTENRRKIADKPRPWWVIAKNFGRKHWRGIVLIVLLLLVFTYLKEQQ